MLRLLALLLLAVPLLAPAQGLNVYPGLNNAPQALDNYEYQRCPYTTQFAAPGRVCGPCTGVPSVTGEVCQTCPSRSAPALHTDGYPYCSRVSCASPNHIIQDRSAPLRYSAAIVGDCVLCGQGEVVGTGRAARCVACGSGVDRVLQSPGSQKYVCRLRSCPRKDQWIAVPSAKTVAAGCRTCSTGEVNTAQTSCTPCATHFTRTVGQDGRPWCRRTSCADANSYVSGQSCVACPSSSVVNADGTGCTGCQAHYSARPGPGGKRVCKRTSCAAVNAFVRGDDCPTCTGRQVVNSAKTACTTCITGRRPNADHTRCEAILCDPGMGLSGDTCLRCEGNDYSAHNLCVSCSAGVTNAAHTACETSRAHHRVRIANPNEWVRVSCPDINDYIVRGDCWDCEGVRSDDWTTCRVERENHEARADDSGRRRWVRVREPVLTPEERCRNEGRPAEYGCVREVHGQGPDPVCVEWVFIGCQAVTQ